MAENFNPDTYKYITTHKKNVFMRMQAAADILTKRGLEHDNSKLETPEFDRWCLMDQEPRYKYGTKEYKQKMEKWHPLLELHYSNPANRHHPENFKDNFDIAIRRDLFDIIEMICDWLAYKDKITYTEASDLVMEQCKRYGFSEELSDLILNTLKNNFVNFGGIDTPPKNVLNIYNQKNKNLGSVLDETI